MVNTTGEATLKTLVDRLMDLAMDTAIPEITTFVGHRWPDDDVWLCCWMGRKFFAKAANARIVFVNAGERLPGSENDPSVVHFDTGGGEFDQHPQEYSRICSATLLRDKLLETADLQDDVIAALDPLLEMVTKVDNVERLERTSMHYLIEGYPRNENFKDEQGGIDWIKVQERVFEGFDILYGQAIHRIRSKQTLAEVAIRATLRNGLKMVTLIGHPECRDPAFDEGAAVVLWTQRRGKHGFNVGIPASRKYPALNLERVIVAIRSAEAAKRGLDVEGINLSEIGIQQPVPGWFMHSSRKLIACGTRTHKLAPGEFTKLTSREIGAIIQKELSAIPWAVTQKWINQVK